jgi:hypothetical protein
MTNDIDIIILIIIGNTILYTSSSISSATSVEDESSFAISS